MRNYIAAWKGKYDPLKHRTSHCDLTLKFYGLSAPEGSLAQSVVSEQKVNALEASFIQAPPGENVDWRLSARISFQMSRFSRETYDRFVEFMKRSNAVSPTVALETATVLQKNIEKMTLAELRSNFRWYSRSKAEFLLDHMGFFFNFGHAQPSACHNSKMPRTYALLLIGVEWLLLWIRLRCLIPSHPSMRVSVQVPNFGLHFSPARYRRLMELLDILYRTMPETEQPTLKISHQNMPMVPPILLLRPDPCLEGDWLLSCFMANYVILCYLVYLFMPWTLSSPTVILDAQVWLVSKHYEIPPANIGGTFSCISISARGMDLQKVLESSNTMIIEFRDE
ncbi:hypothetical protein HAX54_045889 [Datura stramonium]|uniref:Uncharacterized protein n=1 Tax=Datura stramonium TaxID=4076 RepID=A0ABS8SS51_DATST|nr:hypothetical protein [Datura stramonium]